MENRSSLPDKPMMTAMSFLEMLSIEMTFDEFYEFSAYALLTVKPFKKTTKLVCTPDENGLCELMLDVAHIKAVSADTYVFHNWNTAQTLWGDNQQVSTDEFGNTKLDYSTPNDRVYGEYLDFEVVSKSSIRVSKSFEGQEIFVLCAAPILDEDGNPMMTLKQIKALAYQVAVLYAEKQSFMGGTSLDVNYLSQKASRATAQARVPDYISDNEWNEIMDVRTSWDRKKYNKDFKFR